MIDRFCDTELMMNIFIYCHVGVQIEEPNWHVSLSISMKSVKLMFYLLTHLSQTVLSTKFTTGNSVISGFLIVLLRLKVME